ncbi:MAG: hypothetical protein QOH03_126 [Kribbellaceae bacterium]|nr:hypothetical protein [Kribbellaceae bacterium]
MRVGLGSHDLGVATFAAQLYQQRLFSTLLFTGGTSRTTAASFLRGEAAHYRERASGQRNDGRICAAMSQPYMERRAFATCQKVWPEAEVICASEQIELADYIDRLIAADDTSQLGIGVLRLKKWGQPRWSSSDVRVRGRSGSRGLMASWGYSSLEGAVCRRTCFTRTDSSP